MPSQFGRLKKPKQKPDNPFSGRALTNAERRADADLARKKATADFVQQAAVKTPAKPSLTAPQFGYLASLADTYQHGPSAVTGRGSKRVCAELARLKLAGYLDADAGAGDTYDEIGILAAGIELLYTHRDRLTPSQSYAVDRAMIDLHPDDPIWQERREALDHKEAASFVVSALRARHLDVAAAAKALADVLPRAMLEQIAEAVEALKLTDDPS